MLPSCGEKMSTTKAIMDTTGSLHVGCRPPSRVLRGKRAKCSAAAVDSCSSADANLAVRSSSCAGGGGGTIYHQTCSPHRCATEASQAKPASWIWGSPQRIPCLPHMRRQVASEARKPPSTRRHAKASGLHFSGRLQQFGLGAFPGSCHACAPWRCPLVPLHGPPADASSTPDESCSLTAGCRRTEGLGGFSQNGGCLGAPVQSAGTIAPSPDPAAAVSSHRPSSPGPPALQIVRAAFALEWAAAGISFFFLGQGRGPAAKGTFSVRNRNR